MPIKNKDIKHIQAFVSTFQHKYKNEMNQVVELFKKKKNRDNERSYEDN